MYPQFFFTVKEKNMYFILIQNICLFHIGLIWVFSVKSAIATVSCHKAHLISSFFCVSTLYKEADYFFLLKKYFQYVWYSFICILLFLFWFIYSFIVLFVNAVWMASNDLYTKRFCSINLAHHHCLLLKWCWCDENYWVFHLSFWSIKT